MNKKLFLLFISIFLSLNFVFAQNDEYIHVGGSIDGETSTTISNTSTNGLVDTARYIGLMASAAIVTLVIFKLIQGAVLKGTYDNIYDQQKGNKILKNAATSFLIFVFVNLLFSYINPDYGSWIFNTSSSVGGSFGGGGASSSWEQEGKCINDPVYYSKSVEDQIKYDEEGGKHKSWVYMDTTGHATIGWGFNLAQSGASQILKEAGIKSEKITTLLSTACKNVSVTGTSASPDKNCNVTIDEGEANALFNTEFIKRKNDAIAWAGGQTTFDKLPENIKKVIINMSYNMGAGGLATFSESGDTKQGLKKSDWGQMAYGIIDSDYCKQVKGRCGRLVSLVYNGKCPSGTSSTNNTSLYGNNKARCDAIKSIKQSDLVDLKTYGISCTSSYGCLIKKDVAEDLKKLDAAYYDKFKTHISIASAYRSDVQQADTCRSVQGTLCAKPCSQGGVGSNHSFGDAVDFSNETIGNCSKTGPCNNDKFNWLKDPFGGGRFNLYNKLTDDNPHFSRSGR